MAVIPRLQTTLDSVNTFLGSIQTRTLPMIQGAAAGVRDTVTAITKGKNPTPQPIQQPAAMQELVPRNVGGLPSGTLFGVSTTMLLVGLIGVAFIWYSTRRR